MSHTEQMREALRMVDRAVYIDDNGKPCLNSTFDDEMLQAALTAPAAEVPEQSTRLRGGVPEIDYDALIRAAFAKNRKWAQGTNGCVAFAKGAEWFREQALTAAPQAPALDAGVVRDAVLAERERLIQLVIGRAQHHNGPHLLTLELNQLAAWMAGKDWHGVPPPAAAMSAQAGTGGA